jgi:cytochrome c
MKLQLAVLALALTAAVSAQADEALAQSKGCLACHQVDKKVVGPAYRDVAKKNQSAEVLAKSIKAGSRGKYGPVPMPANRVTDAEAAKLAAWINSLK